jgi:GAF domain-containing protein
MPQGRALAPRSEAARVSESPLSESFVALSQFFVGDRTVEDTLRRVAELAVEAVEPADFVGLTLLIEGRQRTAVFTDPASPEIDQTQYDTGEGPCLEAFDTGLIVSLDSTLEDGPYPAFRKAAAARGILSTLSLPLVAGHASVGAMNLYSNAEHGFSSSDRGTATDFASHAAIVLANAQAYWDAHSLSLRLHESMEFRAIIEQAKGILMAAEGCSADEAFDVLVAASQRENVKLRDIAQRMVDRTRSSAAPSAEAP